MFFINFVKTNSKINDYNKDNNTKCEICKIWQIKYKHRLHGKLERTVNTFKNITALKKLYSSRKILCYDFSQ